MDSILKQIKGKLKQDMEKIKTDNRSTDYNLGMRTATMNLQTAGLNTVHKHILEMNAVQATKQQNKEKYKREANSISVNPDDCIRSRNYMIELYKKPKSNPNPTVKGNDDSPPMWVHRLLIKADLQNPNLELQTQTKLTSAIFFYNLLKTYKDYYLTPHSKSRQLFDKLTLPEC